MNQIFVATAALFLSIGAHAEVLSVDGTDKIEFDIVTGSADPKGTKSREKCMKVAEAINAAATTADGSGDIVKAVFDNGNCYIINPYKFNISAKACADAEANFKSGKSGYSTR